MDYPIVETDTYILTMSPWTSTPTPITSPTVVLTAGSTAMSLPVTPTYSEHCKIDNLRVVKKISWGGGIFVDVTKPSITSTTEVSGLSISGSTSKTKDDSESWLLFGDSADSNFTTTNIQSTPTGPVTLPPTISNLKVEFITHMNIHVQAE